MTRLSKSVFDYHKLNFDKSLRTHVSLQRYKPYNLKLMNQDGWDIFIQLCLVAKKTEALSALFDVFLTMEEKSDIAMRCLIVKDLLENKKTQRQMAKELKVSIAKITRGSNALKILDPQLIDYLRKYFSKT